MTLNTVTVTWDERDFTLGTVSGSITFAPTATVIDTADGFDVNVNAKTYYFVNGTGSSDPMVACDTAGLSPAGWGYNVTVQINGLGTPRQFTTFVNFANGASQKLSSLVPAQSVAAMAAYMLLPTGTASAGLVPVATGVGGLSAWGTAPPAGVAATAPVPVTTTAETVVASFTVPAGLPVGASYRVTAWGSLSIGLTAGSFVSKLRLGGLAGVQVSSASSGSFTASSTGFWVAEATVTIQSQGANASWSGFSKQLESVSGTNSNSMGAGTATASSVTTELLVLTIALSSATASASCLGSVVEPRIA